jgi:hypothetical protein
VPIRDGTGPEGKGQRCRILGPTQSQGGGRDRAKRSSGGRRSGGGMGFGQRQGQDKKWQRNEKQ